jgi:hypothetical protein
MFANAFPVKEANLLIENPKNILLIGFLGGEQGLEIDASIKRDYKEFPIMQKVNYNVIYSGGIVKGSNPFYTVGVQSKIPLGERVATQGDLETAMRVGALDLSGTYEETSLVLRTDGYPNPYLAGNLMRQINYKLGKKAKLPVVIPLYGLELVKDQDSPHGLAFKLKEDAEINYAPILEGSNNHSFFNSEDVDSKTGLPTKFGNGNRSLYTSNSGLSRLYLVGKLLLISELGGLSISGEDGRVVLVSTAKGM